MRRELKWALVRAALLSGVFLAGVAGWYIGRWWFFTFG